jgi:hydrogenase/urease accessory protein HupE
MKAKSCIFDWSWRWILLATTCLLVWPATACAHLVSTGFGPFYDGIMHLVLSPDNLLGVLAIALLSGLVGARHGKAALFTLSATWLAGGLLGLQFDKEISLQVVSTLSFLVVGALIALDRKLPLTLVAGLATALGLLHGVLNGTAMMQAGGGFLALVGIATAVFVIAAIVAAFVVSLRTAWARVAVRVVGSWITAIGLLMLGWAFQG